MSKYEEYERIDKLFRAFIREVKAYDRLSAKVSVMGIGKQYECSSAKLTYNAAALEKMRHSLMLRIEECGLSGHIPEDATYYPSNFHEVK